MQRIRDGQGRLAYPDTATLEVVDRATREIAAAAGRARVSRSRAVRTFLRDVVPGWVEERRR